MIRIKLRIGDDPVERGFSGDAITLGRSSTCQVVLGERRVSRLHARIERIGEQVRLTDQKSGNGTRLNGRKIESHPILVGDTIGIGPLMLTVMGLASTME